MARFDLALLTLISFCFPVVSLPLVSMTPIALSQLMLQASAARLAPLRKRHERLEGAVR
jgi:hypothetical protein